MCAAVVKVTSATKSVTRIARVITYFHLTIQMKPEGNTSSVIKIYGEKDQENKSNDKHFMH